MSNISDDWREKFNALVMFGNEHGHCNGELFILQFSSLLTCCTCFSFQLPTDIQFRFLDTVNHSNWVALWLFREKIMPLESWTLRRLNCSINWSNKVRNVHVLSVTSTISDIVGFSKYFSLFSLNRKVRMGSNHCFRSL
jgi:hypothetical protein